MISTKCENQAIRNGFQKNDGEGSTIQDR